MRWARAEAKARRSLTGAIWATHNKRQAKPAKQVQSDLRNDWDDSYHRVLRAYQTRGVS